MKALLCTRAGTPDDLIIGDLPDPVAGPGQAVVRVEAVALNFFDLLIIAGKYQYKPEFPFSPGAEFAGHSRKPRPRCRRVCRRRTGHRLCALGRGAREGRRSAPSKLVKIPAGLEADRAAGLIVTYGTSYYALKDRAGLKRGETLAVLGASGGVGLAAVELGKLMGARVIACASSDDKLDFARQHGADDGVNYASGDLRDGLKKLGGDHGIDVVYDPIGDRYAEPALRSLAWYGRYLVVGFAAGRDPEAAAQPGAAEKLRRPRRVLGFMDRARAGRASRQHRRSGALVCRGQAQRARACRLSAGRGGAGAEGHRRTQGDGQSGVEAVTALRSWTLRSSAPARRARRRGAPA